MIKKLYEKLNSNEMAVYIYEIIKAVMIGLCIPIVLLAIYEVVIQRGYLDVVNHYKQINRYDTSLDSNCYYEDWANKKNHINELSILLEDNWKNASYDEKINGAKYAMYYSVAHYNLTGEFNLIVTDLDNERLGGYDFEKRNVYIDETFLYTAPGEEVFNCINHEIIKVYAESSRNAYWYVPDCYKKLDIFFLPRMIEEDYINQQLVSCPYEGECSKNLEEYATVNSVLNTSNLFHTLNDSRTDIRDY